MNMIAAFMSRLKFLKPKPRKQPVRVVAFLAVGPQLSPSLSLTHISQQRAQPLPRRPA